MKTTYLLALIFILATSAWSAETLRFVLIADPQMEFTKESPGLDKNFLAVTVDEINHLSPPAELALILGDMVQASHSTEQWDDYFSEINKLIIPYYEVMGNHDGRNREGLHRWRNTWKKEDYYAFTHNGVFFMGLNSNLLKAADQLPEETATQNTFISCELATNKTNPHKFIFQHYPLYLTDPDEPYDAGKNIPIKERKTLLNLIDEYDVKAVFNGHRHYQIENDYNGTLLLTANPSAGPLGQGKRGYYIVTYNLDTESTTYEFIENTPAKLIGNF
jgi:predicted phosphodiesterase